MPKITVEHEFSGLGDFWGGNGDRWDDNAGCLFAYYGRDTTLKDCVDSWVSDYWNGGDCDSFPEDVTDDDIRTAILDSLTHAGREDYESGALAECAVEYADVNGPPCCKGCDSRVGQEHEPDCDCLEQIINPDDDDRWVCEEDCAEYGDCYESPMWVILVKIELCPECGAFADCGYNEVADDCCESCYKKRWLDDGEPSILYNFDEWFDSAVKRVCAA